MRSRSSSLPCFDVESRSTREREENEEDDDNNKNKYNNARLNEKKK